MPIDTIAQDELIEIRTLMDTHGGVAGGKLVDRVREVIDQRNELQKSIVKISNEFAYWKKQGNAVERALAVELEAADKRIKDLETQVRTLLSSGASEEVMHLRRIEQMLLDSLATNRRVATKAKQKNARK